MADLESLALDLAALLVVDTQSDQTITVFLPNLRLCKDLVLLVKKQINLYINTDMGSIRRCNLEGLIEYQPCSGSKKIIEIFPAKTFYLRGTLIGDFVVKTRGDAEFERVFDMSCWNPTRQRHYVNVEFANSSETNVDVLATQIDNMDLSD